jgi:DNA-directed RNA polymerase subunit M/transcription elongation factor TFIIS
MTSKQMLDIHTGDNEYLNKFNFIMENSMLLPISLIKYAEENLKRKEAIKKLDMIISCYTLAEDIEAGIFEFTINYVQNNNFSLTDLMPIYEDKLHEIYINLDQKNDRILNKTLLNDLLESKMSGQIIAFLKMYQLHPIRWKHIIDKNNLRDNTLSTINTTDDYRCARCGERKHIYYITQTRSADEPATIFLTCTVCKKTFTKSM